MNKPISFVMAGAFVFGLSSHAYGFIDERTPPEPEFKAEALVMNTGPDSSGALFTQSNTGPILSDPYIVGNLEAPIWTTSYPGPYGEMPMADAVLAQVVPIKGAIMLDGDAALLQRKVRIAEGMSRKDTLIAMAKASGITINLGAGNTVVVSPARLGANPDIRIQESQVAEIIAPGTEPIVQAASSPELAPAVITADPVAVTETQTVSAVVEPPPAPVPVWTIPRGVMLSAGLRSWFEEEGWQLVWRAKVDYQIVAPVSISADFLTAVDKMLDAYKNSQRPLIGYSHAAQRVVVVSEPGMKEAAVDQRPVGVVAPAGAASLK